ncbi:unnamed protein product [marine sediment metagenome]|uniref:Uncharacterized protein n=1 Tax=marine sediment metagenome TaxID=412755 RepID=X0Z214_9ZZZZ
MEDEILSDEDKSQFNAGIATLQRCNEIKKFLAASSGDPESCLKYIKMFYKELYPMMSMTKKSNERSIQVAYWQKGKEIEKKFAEGIQINQDDRDFLDEWELELRDIEQVKNMNIPKTADSRWGLAGR